MAIIFEMISNGWLRNDLATPIPNIIIIMMIMTRSALYDYDLISKYLRKDLC